MARKKWSEIRDQRYERDPAAPARVVAAARTMDDLERLWDLRRTRGVSQERLAMALEVSQARVSALEKSEDIRLSTVRRYVEALGGRLELKAVFDDEEIPL